MAGGSFDRLAAIAAARDRCENENQKKMRLHKLGPKENLSAEHPQLKPSKSNNL